MKTLFALAALVAAASAAPIDCGAVTTLAGFTGCEMAPGLSVSVTAFDMTVNGREIQPHEIRVDAYFRNENPGSGFATVLMHLDDCPVEMTGELTLSVVFTTTKPGVRTRDVMTYIDVHEIISVDHVNGTGPLPGNFSHSTEGAAVASIHTHALMHHHSRERRFTLLTLTQALILIETDNNPSAATPEPTTASAIVLGLCYILVRRRVR